MSTPVEFESLARQDFGPTTSTVEYQPLLVHKLADTMSIPSVDVPQAMPSDMLSEPDSTEPAILHVYRTKHLSEGKDDEYVIAEPDTAELPSDEATTETYTIVEREEPDEAGFITATSATLVATPTPAIVQNITKLPQNYTLNVEASVSSIATIQSTPCVSSSNQMLLLPTILAAGSQPIDSKPLDVDSSAGISQIIITSDAYSNNLNQSSQRTNILPETNFITRPKPSKVQILSNIALPKSSSVLTYSQQYVTTEATLYNSTEHVYKINTGTTGVHPKHVNSAIKPTKIPASVSYPNISPSVINQALKSVSYTHTFPKGTNTKSHNKLNNGANPTSQAAVGVVANQCHILSRVVAGPKLAVQPGRKAVNTFGKGTKTSQNNNCGNQKGQSRSVKIIQQTATSKPDMKSWSITNSKITTAYSADGGVKTLSQKMSPTHKSSHTHQLFAHKPGKNEQRVILQSPCGPVVISTAPISISHRPSHYVQAGTPSLRYVHNYVQTSLENVVPNMSTQNQGSGNQHLTAQILQSLSQPKLMLQPSAPIQPPEPYSVPPKPAQHRRHISGDPTTMLTAEEIIGIEERPNLTQDIIRYTHDTLALVMLDHTYALSAQKLSPVPTCSPSVISTAPPITSPALIATPTSPIKGSPPMVTSTIQNDFQMITSSAPVPTSPISTFQTLSFAFKQASLPSKPDEDAASNISSNEGRAADKAGSDTETAPEVEDGKTRCICDFTHDDGYMICCDRCGEWQHVDCMGIDRNNIPDAYQCSYCQPRKVERRIARQIQMRKREEFGFHGSGSDSSDGTHSAGLKRKKLLTVTTYSDTSGTCVTSYNSLPTPLPQPPASQPKRSPVKRQKKADMMRKVTKRKLTEKKMKRKKDMTLNRSKYASVNSAHSGWHETYEQAVTNHYSPELRAKIMKYGSKTGNAQSSLAQAVSAHHCTTVPHAGGKILIATTDLQENTPIIELRGKYMLSNQHRPQLVSSRSGGQKPGPFVFFYRLPKDNTQVCIDTRTYGNEARFVRRSCKYNAELQHCIVKGTLHVYIVGIGEIADGTEITIPHDHSGKQPCACGNPKHCKLNGFNTVAARKAPAEYTQPREKRTRHRRSSSSSASPQDSPVEPPQRRLSVISSGLKSPIKMEFGSSVKTWGTTFTDAPMSDSIFEDEKPEAEETKPLVNTEDVVDHVLDTIKAELKEELGQQEPELVDEVKMDPETVKEELKECTSPLKEEIEEKVIVKEEIKLSVPDIEMDKIPMPEGPPPKPKEEEKEKEKEKEREKVTRSVTARSVERSTRSSRSSVAAAHNDSQDEKTDDSQDKSSEKKDKKKMTREERKMEAIMRAFERMEKAEARKQEVRERQSKRRESDPAPSSVEREDDEDGAPAVRKRRQRRGRARTASQNTSRRRLNSADSDMATSGDEITSPRDDPATPVPITPSTPDVSSACLLVEAAVGKLESAFKLPKTKKTIANEWVGRSPDRTAYNACYRSPPMSARSLDSLVVASTIIGDLGGNTSEPDDGSPPRTPNRTQPRPPKKAKRGAAKAPEPTPPPPPQQQNQQQHSAKKRWLRQAISEESDSPTAESPPSEIVTPLKKRRLARESLSLDQPAFNKPDEVTTPVPSEDSPTKDDSNYSITRHCKMKSRYIDSMYGSDFGGDSSMEAHNSYVGMHQRDEKFLDKIDIRRIIGIPMEETFEDIPMPEVVPQPRTPERPKPIDVNDNEFQHNVAPEEEKISKVTPMEIDTEISAHDAIAEDKVAETPTESTTHSNDNSGNSSPLRDEIDDIQKKIHSFHDENIQILKIRNKKPPKEKRKKVNLNFDLSMVNNQISVQLRTDDSSPRPDRMNGDMHFGSQADRQPVMVPEDSIPLPPPPGATGSNTSYIPWTEDIPLPEEPMKPRTPEPKIIPTILAQENALYVETSNIVSAESPSSALISVSPTIVTPRTVPTPESPKMVPAPESPKMVSAPDSPKMMPAPEFTEMVPAPERIDALTESSPVAPVTVSPPESPEKAVCVRRSPERKETGLFSGLFADKNAGAFSERSADELQNVREILDRVNSMDASTSAILCGVLNADVAATKTSLSPVKTFASRVDPRVGVTPADKPKPVRRKLSITEYLKRHKPGGANEPSDSNTSCGPAEAEPASSDSSASRSPLRLDPSEELEMRLSQALKAPLVTSLPHMRGVIGAVSGEFDAQPTQLERQRENLSQRLRREFGLSLPEDEDARSPTALGSELARVAATVESAELPTVRFPRPLTPLKPPVRHDR